MLLSFVCSPLLSRSTDWLTVFYTAAWITRGGVGIGMDRGDGYGHGYGHSYSNISAIARFEVNFMFVQPVCI